MGVSGTQLEAGGILRRLTRTATLRHADLVDPDADAIVELGRELGLDRGLVKQLQDATLAPGLVSVARWFLARLDVPCYEPDQPFEWKRVDVLLGARSLITLHGKPVTAVPRARQRYEARHGRKGPDTFLALVVSEVVLAFDGVIERLKEEHEVVTRRRAPDDSTPPPEPVTLLAKHTSEVERGLSQLKALLDDFQHPRRHPLVKNNARGELLALRDRLVKMTATVEELEGKIAEISTQAGGGGADVEMESPQIIEAAAAIGERRLHRLTVAHFITALIGGMAISFGGVAMAVTAGPWREVLGPDRAHLLAAVVFPIGFLILILGKGELFTENFFVPVTSVWKGRGSVGHLLSLWGSTLLFNLVGAVIFSFLATRSEVLSESAATFLRELAAEKTSWGFGTLFIKSLFAGWLMTLLTWLMLAARSVAPRIFIMWAIGFLIVAGHFNHVVISAVEIFMGIWLGGQVTLWDWVWRNFLVALVGNVVGGVVFVTVAGYLQAHSLRVSEQKQSEAVQEPAPPVVPRTPTHVRA